MYYDAFLLSQTILDLSRVSALQVVRLQNPAFDEVRTSEAHKIAGGRRWFDYHRKRGHLKPVRVGRAKNSPVYWSRLQIEALKAAEDMEIRFRKEE